METIVAILIILLFSTVLGETFNKFGLEKIAGQLLSGMILGPLVLNIIRPEEVSQISDLAIYFIILFIGIQVTTDLFKKGIRWAVSLSITSFLIPMILISIPLILFFNLPIFSSFSMSIAIAVPSISIISVMVIRTNLLKYDAGQGILFATVISDLLAFILLGVFYVGAKGVALILIVIFGFLFLIFGMDHLFMKKKFTIENLRIINALGKEEGSLSLILLFSLIIATIFLYMGVSFILGVFFAGVLIREEILGKEIYKRITETLGILNNTFFIPLFFSIAGLISSFPEGIYLYILLFVITLELTVPFLSDYFLARRFFPKEGKKVASILSGRGAVGLLVATLALSYNLINSNEYSIVIISTVALSLFGSIMVREGPKV